jgi:hypothetical protein
VHIIAQGDRFPLSGKTWGVRRDKLMYDQSVKVRREWKNLVTLPGF